MKKEDIYSVCPKCLQPNSGKISIFGEVRIIPIVCNCKKKENDDIKIRQKILDVQYLNRKNNSFIGLHKDKIIEANLFENKDANQFLEKFKKDFKKCYGQWFYLYGVCGNGKTTTLKLIASFLNENGQSYIFTSIDKIFSKIKESFDKDDISESVIFDRIIKAEFLLVDDLGVERITSWGSSQIYHIFNEKYNNGTSIIISSNLNKHKLVEYISTFDKENRIADRIKEKTTFIEFTNKSFRVNNFKF